MSKFVLTLILSSFFLVSLPSAAKPGNEQDRQEIQAIKMQQAQLKAQERLLRLKSALNLKDSQMETWETYEKDMLANVGNRMGMVKKLKQKYNKTGKLPSSIDLAKSNIDRIERQLAAAKTRLAAFSALYNVLDDDQKATVDKLAHKRVKKAARMARERKTKEMRRHN